MKVFLGGTCNNSKWREKLVPVLVEEGIPFFDPVVKDWNEEAQKREDLEKADPMNIKLFYITKEMTGVFSIAEAVDCSNKDPLKTIFVFEDDGFLFSQRKSLDAVGRLIEKNGGIYAKPEELMPMLRDIKRMIKRMIKTKN